MGVCVGRRGPGGPKPRSRLTRVGWEAGRLAFKGAVMATALVAGLGWAAGQAATIRGGLGWGESETTRVCIGHTWQPGHARQGRCGIHIRVSF